MIQKFVSGYSRMGMAVAGVLGTSVAMAAEGDTLPPGAEEAFTSLQSYAASMIDAAWPAVIAIFVGLFGIRFFKRIGSKI